MEKEDLFYTSVSVVPNNGWDDSIHILKSGIEVPLGIIVLVETLLETSKFSEQKSVIICLGGIQ